MSKPGFGEKSRLSKNQAYLHLKMNPFLEQKPNKFACPECGKTFNAKSEMERHRETTQPHKF